MLSSLNLEKYRKEKEPWGDRNGTGRLRAGQIIVQIEGVCKPSAALDQWEDALDV